MATVKFIIIFINLLLFTGSSAQENACIIGDDAIQRLRVDHGNEYAAVFPSKTWDCEGPIVEWQYFSFNDRPINAIVFEKAPNVETNWRVVDFNVIPVASGGFGRYRVPENLRITVKPDDVLGYSGSNVKFVGEGDIVHINRYSEMGSTLQKGEVYKMDWPPPERRTYSLKSVMETPQISFNFARGKVDEGSITSVTLTNVGEYTHSIRVETVDGEAKAGVDYAQNVMTYTIDGGETVTFEVRGLANTIQETEAKDFRLAIFAGNTQIDYTDNFEQVITVTSDIPCPDFWWQDVAETITIVEGESPVQLVAARLDTAQAETIEFDLRHISSENDDLGVNPDPYRLSFNPGASSSSGVVSIMAREDCVAEGDETFMLTLHDPISATCSNRARRTPYVLLVTIRDDNDARYSWKQTMVTVGESSGSAKLCITRSGCLNPVSIDLRCDAGSAGVRSDFTPPSQQQIEFIMAQAEACIDIPITRDIIAESTESFTCTMSSSLQDAIVATQNVATVFITDDDEVVSVGWEQATYVYTEGDTMVAPVIRKVGNIDLIISVISTPVTATPSSDYSISSAMDVTIPATSSAYAFNMLEIVDDNIIEMTETFTLTITATSFGTISSSVVTIHIADNDGGGSSNSNSTSGASNEIGGGAVAAIAVASGIAGVTLLVATTVLWRWCSRGVSQPVKFAGAGGGVPTANQASVFGYDGIASTVDPMMDIVPYNSGMGYLVGESLQGLNAFQNGYF